MTLRDGLALLGLGTVWLNGLLVAGAALIELRRVWRRHRRLGPFARGTIESALGEGGALATFEVEQVGRSKGDGQIFFHDRSRRSAVHGGVVRFADGVCLELPAELEARVLVPTRVLHTQAAAQGDTLAAYEQAQKARGFARTLSVSLTVGQRVWMSAQLETRAAQGAPVAIAVFNPAALVRSAAWRVLGFVVASLAALTACTALALWPPVYGTVSTVGAVALFAYFLLVQPLGVTLRDALRPPDRALVRGRWGVARAGGEQVVPGMG